MVTTSNRVKYSEAIAYLYKVKIGSLAIDQLYWTECSGLGVEYVTEPYEEGGNNAFVYTLVGRAKYPNITLKRPIDEFSERIATWVSKQRVLQLEPVTGSIEVLDGQKQTIVTYNLEGIVPVKWTGPSLNATTSGVATESLELAHQGFTGAGFGKLHF